MHNTVIVRTKNVPNHNSIQCLCTERLYASKAACMINSELFFKCCRIWHELGRNCIICEIKSRIFAVVRRRRRRSDPCDGPGAWFCPMYPHPLLCGLPARTSGQFVR